LIFCMTAVVTGVPVATTPSGIHYVSASAGAHASYFVRSDGSIDRLKGGSAVSQRVPPPEGTKYIAASAGLHASYFLREDGAVDRTTGGQVDKIETISPAAQGSMKDLFAGKAKYVAVSNSMGPCYLLRSDGKVDCVRSGEVNQTLDNPYVQIAGGTDCSYHLKEDGSVDKIWAKGQVQCTFPGPYVAVATQGIGAKNDKGGGGATSIYFIKADGSVDRASIWASKVETTMVPPTGVKYTAVSCQDTASYLLRSDGAIDRTTGGGKVSNTMNPPPGGTYVYISAGQWASYFVRSDGKIDRTTGGGRISATIDPAAEPEEKGNCTVM